MKKVLCVVLALVLVLVMSASAFATGTGKIRLSEMSDEECIAFLKESGIEIPPVFDDELTWAHFARNKIKEVEANPKVVFFYNYSVLYQFANDIKTAVNAYYGITDSEVTELPEVLRLCFRIVYRWDLGQMNMRPIMLMRMF